MVDAGFEALLHVGDVTIDQQDIQLLHAVDDHRSLNAATDALGRSYSRALDRITTLESVVGPLVERRRGGTDGGGSTLTPNGHDLLHQFTRLQTALDSTATSEEIVLDGSVIDRDGEIALIETPIGHIRAVLFEDGNRVQVIFRADAITLHSPETAPVAEETSARNRFRGSVTSIDRDEAIATVTVVIGEVVEIRVIVTRQSLETLELSEGLEVEATFKATATRAIPV